MSVTAPPLRNVNHKRFSLSGIILIPFEEDEIDFRFSVDSKKVAFIQGNIYLRDGMDEDELRSSAEHNENQ